MQWHQTSDISSCAAHAGASLAIDPLHLHVPSSMQDDFDIGAEEEAQLEVKDRPEVQEKLERRIRSVEVKILNPPRPGGAAASWQMQTPSCAVPSHLDTAASSNRHD